MIVGGYQISNALIAALLVASTAGAGVATDSFSDVGSGFDIPLSGPSDNVTDQNTTYNQQDSDNDNDSQQSDGSDSDSGQDSNQDSSDNSSGDNSDSEDSDGTGDQTPVNDEDNESLGDVNDTEDELPNVGNNESDEEDQTDENVSEGDQPTNDTEEGPTSEVPAIYTPAPDESFESATLPLDVILNAENASYDVKIDGSSKLSGQLDGEKTVQQDIDISQTGSHRLDVLISRDGEVLHNQSRQFSIADSAIDNKTGIFVEGNLTAEEYSTVRIWQEGETVEGESIYLNGDSIGQTDEDGSVYFEVPNVQEATISTDLDLEEITETVQGYENRTPEFTINSPSEGQTIETFDNETEVSFNYTVEDKGWADNATIEIQETGDSYTRPISSGETYGDNFNPVLEASDAGEEYSYSLELYDEDRTTSKTAPFSVQIVEPQGVVSLDSPRGDTSNYDTFDIYLQADVAATFSARIKSQEDMQRTWMQCDGEGDLVEETVTYSEGEIVGDYQTDLIAGQEIDTDFTQVMVIKGNYTWSGELQSEEDGMLVQKSPVSFKTLEEPDGDTQEDCYGTTG